MKLGLLSRNKKQGLKIVTTNDLIDVVSQKGIIPLPEYSRNKEASFIVQPRGSIFVKLKRKKKIDI